MELLPHLLEHAFEDTIYLVPFLLATYILLELLEHKAGDKAAVLVRKAGIAGPFVDLFWALFPNADSPLQVLHSMLVAQLRLAPFLQYFYLLQTKCFLCLSPSRLIPLLCFR